MIRPPSANLNMVYLDHLWPESRKSGRGLGEVPQIGALTEGYYGALECLEDIAIHGGAFFTDADIKAQVDRLHVGRPKA